MSIWGMPSVEDQLTVTLVRWRILRIKAKKTSIDLVLGWCIEVRSCAGYRLAIAFSQGISTESGFPVRKDLAGWHHATIWGAGCRQVAALD